MPNSSIKSGHTLPIGSPIWLQAATYDFTFTYNSTFLVLSQSAFEPASVQPGERDSQQ
jgi:hypothetical protein